MRKVTYGRLGKFLQSLGFSKHEPEPGTLVYKHEASGALVILPIRKDHENVAPHHLVGTRMILDAFGIMDPPEFTEHFPIAS
jgi:hypothetical protein